MSGLRLGLVPLLAILCGAVAVLSVALVLIARPTALAEERAREASSASLAQAQSLSAALADRHELLLATLTAEVPSMASGTTPVRPDALERLDIMQLCLVDPATGAAQRLASGFGSDCPVRYDWHARTMLTDLAAADGVRISGVTAPRGAEPRLYAALTVGDRIAVATIATTHFQSLAAAGSADSHAVIVDATGRVVAHPMRGWSAARADLSQVSAVQRVLAGEGGIVSYRAPSIGADVIAGIAAVPGTGWGVLVPSPLSDLTAPLGLGSTEVRGAAFAGFAFATFAGALAGFLLSVRLTRMHRAARDIVLGQPDIHIPDKGPAEVAMLGTRLNAMLGHLERTHLSDHTRRVTAERASRRSAGILSLAKRQMDGPANHILRLSQDLRNAEVTTQQAVKLDQIIIECRAMIATLHDVLEICRLEAGELTLGQRRFDAARQILAAARQWSAVAEKRGHALVVRMPTDRRVWVSGDDARLRHVVGTLIRHGLQADRRESVIVDIDLTDRADGKLDVKLDVSGPPRDGAADCLGQTVCARLVGLMGGTLKTDGDGTRSMTLPLQVSQQSDRAPDPEQLAGLQVHVIATDKAQRACLAAYASTFGADVCEHADADGALDNLSITATSVVVFDPYGSSMNGDAFRAAVAAIAPDLPVAVIGDHTDTDHACGLDAPVDPFEMAAQLAELHQSRAHPAGLSRSSVLIIDPDPSRQAALGLLLDGLGLRPEFVPDVVDAINALKGDPGLVAAIATVRHPDFARIDADALRDATSNPANLRTIALVESAEHLSWTIPFDSIFVWPPSVADLDAALHEPVSVSPAVVAAAG